MSTVSYKTEFKKVGISGGAIRWSLYAKDAMDMVITLIREFEHTKFMLKSIPLHQIYYVHDGHPFAIEAHELIDDASIERAMEVDEDGD